MYRVPSDSGVLSSPFGTSVFGLQARQRIGFRSRAGVPDFRFWGIQFGLALDGRTL
jgi:hypothetical protein